MPEGAETQGVGDQFVDDLQNGPGAIVDFCKRISGLNEGDAARARSQFESALALHFAKNVSRLPIGDHGEMVDFTRTQQAIVSTWRTAAGMVMNGVINLGVKGSESFLKAGNLHEQRRSELLQK